MKYRIVSTAAIAATGAYAQQQYPGSSSSSPVNPAYTPPASSSPAVSPSASYVTVTYDDCPSQSIESLITMTQGVTVTYCPECDHDTPTSKPGPSHTTVYTTVYQSLCSTGLVPVTYTVTEECEEPTPTWASTKGDHVPQGFTVTVKECHVCDKTPVPVTITEPCKDGCGKKTPAPPAATGPSGGKVSQIPDGQVQAPGPSGGKVSQIPDGQVQAPGPSGGAGGSSPSPSGGASNPGGSGNSGSNSPASGGNGSGPNRTPEQSGENCPGPQCNTSGDKSPGTDLSGEKPAGQKPAPGGSASNGASPPYPTGANDKCPGPECKAHGTDSASTPANSGDTSNIELYTPGSAGATVSSLGFISSICMAAAVAVLAFAL